jgi:hypothetical protein
MLNSQCSIVVREDRSYSAAPSDQNWEFGIEHSSDPFFVSLRLL